DVGTGVQAARQADGVRRQPALAPLLRRHRQRLALVAGRPEGARGERAMNFIKSLGLWDVVFMNVVAVVGMRWIARGARTGPASVPLWILAWNAFFVPLALAIAALDRRYPDQAVAYVWVRRALGQGHGFICCW